MKKKLLYVAYWLGAFVLIAGVGGVAGGFLGLPGVILSFVWGLAAGYLAMSLFLKYLYDAR